MDILREIWNEPRMPKDDLMYRIISCCCKSKMFRMYSIFIFLINFLEPFVDSMTGELKCLIWINIFIFVDSYYFTSIQKKKHLVHVNANVFNAMAAFLFFCEYLDQMCIDSTSDIIFLAIIKDFFSARVTIGEYDNRDNVLGTGVWVIN